MSMPEFDNPTELNKLWFDERANLHADSDFYRVQDVIDGEIRLKPYEIEEIGDVTGKDVIQLQCHIGLEAVSLARLGANSTTGLDFSASSLERARQIAKMAEVEVNYVWGDVYDSAELAGYNAYDVVYVNGNSLAWLPDLEKWGEVVESLIRPGGKLYLNAFHPISFSIDGETGAVVRDYFDRDITIWDEPGSYVDEDAETTHNQHAVWVRPVSDVVNAIIRSGLIIASFTERPGQEFQQYPHQYRGPDGLWYNNPELGFQHPSTYSVVAHKKPE
jgi:SAM-dependent methyltransferase